MRPLPFAFKRSPSGGAAPVSFVTSFGTGFELSSSSSSEVGYKFTVGGAAINVTDLGYRRESGTYANRLVNLRDNSGTLIASSTPVYTSVSVGAVAYATVGTPVTLSASGIYHISTARNSGGNFNELRGSNNITDVTGTSVATVNSVTDENQSTSGGLLGYVDFKYN